MTFGNSWLLFVYSYPHSLRKDLTMKQEDILIAKAQLEALVVKYKSFENLSSDQPPKIGTYWSPRYGFLRVSENTVIYDYGLSVRVKISVEIGSKFAENNASVNKAIRAEIIDIFNDLISKHGGSILKKYGTAYSVFGWVQ